LSSVDEAVFVGPDPAFSPADELQAAKLASCGRKRIGAVRFESKKRSAMLGE
jgi:hypothetical protein